MPPGRYCAALDKAQIRAIGDPTGKVVPWEFRPPSELSDDRLQQTLDHVARAGIGPHAADQNQFAARLEHAGAFVERRQGVRNGRDHVAGNDDIE